MKKFPLRYKLPVLIFLAAVTLAGCNPSTPSSADTPDPTTATSTPQTTAPPVDYGQYYMDTVSKLYGLKTTEGTILTDAIYTAVMPLSQNRFCVNVAQENERIVDENGKTILLIESRETHDVICSTLAWPDAPNMPVRFFVNGGIFDENGNPLTEKGVAIQCASEKQVRIAYEDSLYLVDLDGNQLERLDVVKECEELPVGGFVKTQLENFDFVAYGVRTAQSQVVLPERYRNIYPLSADRIVGSDTTIVQSDDAWNTSAIIVDGKSNTVCDKYHELRFFPQADGSYYPYGIARLVIGQGEAVHYFLVDWDGQPLNDAPFEEVPAFADGVFTVKIDGQEVRYSAETGERV